MKYDSSMCKRKSIRLKCYNYSKKGLYFITICIKDKINLLGEINNGKNVLYDSGKMIEKWLFELENKFGNVKINNYVVMPNHFHGIIELNNNNSVGANLCVCPGGEIKINGEIKTNSEIKPNDGEIKTGGTHRFTPTGGKYIFAKNSISEIIKWFKTMTTNEYIKNVYDNNWNTFNGKLWQKNYYEHIIRDEKSFNKITEYIENNPINWIKDELYN